LANKGYEVAGVDLIESAVKKINSGGVHIVEPDLDVLVRSAVNSGQMRIQMAEHKTGEDRVTSKCHWQAHSKAQKKSGLSRAGILSPA
jgi:UDP-N-acetyl-D-mannosaminuronate dehydrogenase